MKNLKRIGALILTAIFFVACSSDDDSGDAAAVNPLAGNWKLANEAGALAVGESAGNYNWWAISAEDVTGRACLFDDLYVLEADGSFKNDLGSTTWLETWQGVEAESCGSPVAPHDGSNTGTWSSTDTQLTISGSGNFMGLAKVHNTGEDGSPVGNEITYNYVLSADGNTLQLTITGWHADVAAAEWFFKFTKQ